MGHFKNNESLDRTYVIKLDEKLRLQNATALQLDGEPPLQNKLALKHHFQHKSFFTTRAALSAFDKFNVCAPNGAM